MVIHGASAHRIASGADGVEGGNKVARIGRAFAPFRRQYAADLWRARIKANRQVDILLKRHARYVGAERRGQGRGLFDAVRRRHDGVAEHWKENVSGRHRVLLGEVRLFRMADFFAMPQCESMQHTGLEAISSCVTPPKIHSPRRLCPYPPATTRSAPSARTSSSSSFAAGPRARRQISSTTTTPWRTR